MNKKIKVFIFILLTSLLLELGLFNFRTIESFLFKQVDYNYDFSLGDGLNNNGDGTITVLKNGEKSFIIENINQEVDNVRLNFNIIEPDNIIDFESEIFISDEGNANYYSIGNHTNINNNLRSSYIRIHPYGKLKSIKIVLNNANYFEKIQFNDISFNKRVVFSFSLIRLIATFFIISLFYMFRSKSKMYNSQISLNTKTISTIIIIILEILLFVGIAKANPVFQIDKNPNLTEYQRLARSFANGDFYLYDEVSKELLNMKNPYDLSERDRLGVKYLWDHAYYNGKYYVYFGAGPVILYYLPYYLATGNDLPNHIAIIISISLFIIFTNLLINKIIEKRFKNIKFPFNIFLSSMIIISCGTINNTLYATIYNVPILTALALTVMGIYFWFDSINDNNINNTKVIIGSLCIAYTILCRPQFILASFLAIPLFYKFIITIKDNKDNRKSFIYALLPYLIVGIVTCYYNYKRFNLPFDFGANYNLTTNDMTKRGFELDRTFDGLFKYLFEFPVITNTFPFIKNTLENFNYKGITIYENMFGGLFITNIILWINLFIFKIKKLFKDKDLYYFSLVSLIIGFVIVLLDTQMSGILQRYFADFAFFFFISASILILVLLNEFNNKEFITDLYFIFFVLGFISIIFNLLLFLGNGQHSIMVYNKELVYKLYEILWWWR